METIMIIIFVLIVLLCFWALVKCGAREDVLREKLLNQEGLLNLEMENQSDILLDLTELERQTFDKLMSEFDKIIDKQEV